MRAALIVEVDEDREGGEPLGVGAIRTGRGSLAKQRADEPFGLAVGVRPRGPGPAVATLAEDGSKGVRAIGEPVVGQHPLEDGPPAAKTARARARAAAALVPLSSGTWTTIARRLRSSTTT